MIIHLVRGVKLLGLLGSSILYFCTTELGVCIEQLDGLCISFARNAFSMIKNARMIAYMM
jgi:hypothetical protein